MYRVNIGYHHEKPTDPIKRAEYILEQMRIYLKINEAFQDQNEYKQVELIFNAFLNALSETVYPKLVQILNSTSYKVTTVYSKSGQYWEEFLKFMHWKMTGRSVI